MSRSDWAVFGCRLIALYLGVIAVLRLGALPTVAEMYRTTHQGVPIMWSVVGFVGPIAAQLLLAVVLWIFARRLTGIVFGSEDSTGVTSGVDVTGLAAVAVFLVGIFLAVTVLTGMASFLGYLQPPPAGGGISDLPDKNRVFRWEPIIVAVIRLAIASSFILGRNYVAKLVAVDTTGNRPAASEEEK